MQIWCNSEEERQKIKKVSELLVSMKVTKIDFFNF